MRQGEPTRVTCHFREHALLLEAGEDVEQRAPGGLRHARLLKRLYRDHGEDAPLLCRDGEVLVRLVPVTRGDPNV